jgi:type IV pilus biogenesis protein CpaD/CtpE
MKTQDLMLIVIAASLAGCADTTPRSDAEFGRSSTLIKAQQVANPDAGRNADPAAGLDGEAARAAMDSYRKSLRTPTSDSGSGPVMTIDSGTTGH